MDYLECSSIKPSLRLDLIDSQSSYYIVIHPYYSSSGSLMETSLAPHSVVLDPDDTDSVIEPSLDHVSYG